MLEHILSGRVESIINEGMVRELGMVALVVRTELFLNI